MTTSQGDKQKKVGIYEKLGIKQIFGMKIIQTKHVHTPDCNHSGKPKMVGVNPGSFSSLPKDYLTFRLRGYNEDLYFNVFVYNSIEDLRLDAEKFTGEGYSDCLGLCHPYERITISKGKKDKVHENIGIIRLSKKHLTTHIVAHELIHAAMWHFRLTQDTRTANFGKHNSKKEEDFGMIYCKYFSKMTRLLYKHKLWK